MGRPAGDITIPTSYTSMYNYVTVNLTKYKLFGVVVHSGQASGGHYYSYILHKYVQLCYCKSHQVQAVWCGGPQWTGQRGHYYSYILHKYVHVQLCYCKSHQVQAVWCGGPQWAGQRGHYYSYILHKYVQLGLILYRLLKAERLFVLRLSSSFFVPLSIRQAVCLSASHL